MQGVDDILDAFAAANDLNFTDRALLRAALTHPQDWADIMVSLSGSS